jgi:hypothetical protein
MFPRGYAPDHRQGDGSDAGGGRHWVRAAERSVLRAFDPARSDSRLVLTSRFPFR